MTKWNYSKILVLAKDGGNRTGIASSLSAAGFHVDFVSASNEVFDMLKAFGNGIFIHDYEALDKTQGDLMQQRMGKMDEYLDVVRIVLAAEITPKLLALASDAHIRRIVSYSTNLAAFGEELKMITKVDSPIHELQKKLKAMNDPSNRTPQVEIDAVIESAYNQYKHDPAIRLEYGAVLLRRGKLDEAKTLAEEILRKDPNNLRAMSLISRVLMRQGKFAEAISSMENANELAPWNTDRLLELGNAFFSTGNLDKAKKSFEMANESVFEGGVTEAKVGLGKIALTDGDAASALDLFVNSCSEEEAAGYFNNSAVQAAKAGKLERALELYKTALSALKTNRLKPAVYYNIALTYADLKNYQEAHKAVVRALKFDKEHKKSQRLREKIERELMRVDRPKSAS